MFLLDTNICIYLMKNSYPHLTQKLFSLDPANFFLSSVTVFELEYGASKSRWGTKSRTNMAMFLAPFTILPFDTEDAFRAGQLRAYLEQNGTPIGPYDVQIASQALQRSLTVVTHNTEEFLRIPGLLVEDWTQPH